MSEHARKRKKESAFICAPFKWKMGCVPFAGIDDRKKEKKNNFSLPLRRREAKNRPSIGRSVGRVQALNVPRKVCLPGF